MGRDKQKIGDVSEFKAVIKFLQEGYWVFRNVQYQVIGEQVGHSLNKLKMKLKSVKFFVQTVTE